MSTRLESGEELISPDSSSNVPVVCFKLPKVLAHFRGVKFTADEIQSFSQLGYPWDLIDKMWGLYLSKMKAGEIGADAYVEGDDDDDVVDSNSKLGYSSFSTIQFGKSPYLYVFQLRVAVRRSDNTLTSHLFSQTITCSGTPFAKQVISSHALHFLAPAMALTIVEEDKSNKIMFMDPLDTRDNIFELNGRTLMEQAMELLSAAWAMTNGGKDGAGDVQRYVDASACWTDYANVDRRLTAEFAALAHQKQEVGLGRKPVTFRWTLENVSDSGVQNLSPNEGERTHYSFRFVLREIQDSVKNAEATKIPESFVICESEYVGEPVTRVIYRGLLSAAKRLGCESVMKCLFFDFALTLCPPLCNAPYEYMEFYMAAFFGKHNPVDNAASNASFLVLDHDVNERPGGWECVLYLNRDHCGFTDGEHVLSGEENRTTMFRQTDSKKAKARSSAITDFGKECFHFVLEAFRPLCEKWERTGKSHQKRYAEGYRRALTSMAKVSVAHERYIWCLEPCGVKMGSEVPTSSNAHHVVPDDVRSNGKNTTMRAEDRAVVAPTQPTLLDDLQLCLKLDEYPDQILLVRKTVRGLECLLNEKKIAGDACGSNGTGSSATSTSSVPVSFRVLALNMARGWHRDFVMEIETHEVLGWLEEVPHHLSGNEGNSKKSKKKKKNKNASATEAGGSDEEEITQEVEGKAKKKALAEGDISWLKDPCFVTVVRLYRRQDFNTFLFSLSLNDATSSTKRHGDKPERLAELLSEWRNQMHYLLKPEWMQQPPVVESYYSAGKKTETKQQHSSAFVAKDSFSFVGHSSSRAASLGQALLKAVVVFVSYRQMRTEFITFRGNSGCDEEEMSMVSSASSLSDMVATTEGWCQSNNREMGPARHSSPSISSESSTQSSDDDFDDSRLCERIGIE